MDYKIRIRKLTSLFVAIVSYFVIHEGAHWAYAMYIGSFKKINFIGIGIQVDIYRDLMTDTQLGIFCLVAPILTVITGYILFAFTQKILLFQSAYIKAIAYYLTLVFLLLDPLYLSVLSFFVGGGDMNGIVLIMPEMVVRIVSGIIVAVNVLILIKIIVPKYRKAYQDDSKIEMDKLYEN